MSWDIELYATENGEEPVMTFLNLFPSYREETRTPTWVCEEESKNS